MMGVGGEGSKRMKPSKPLAEALTEPAALDFARRTFVGTTAVRTVLDNRPKAACPATALATADTGASFWHCGSLKLYFALFECPSDGTVPGAHS